MKCFIKFFNILNLAGLEEIALMKKCKIIRNDTLIMTHDI